ncbi:LysM peptidoglycan-binding domain-containing protein [Sphingomonas sp.]|uniref:LysM peptidoglycan-binding domain-containing protein n=1 Tax=Sphingomonas sp. TaxID=28214 RepID=UPI0025EDF9D1|nr:LysM peptidoglycan-binding domain-containing protein [Sphingomonas sp.]
MIVTAILASSLAACSSGPSRVKTLPAPPAANAAGDVDAAFDLLMQGDEGGARKRLKTALKHDPMNANAQLLNESIARDPKDLLGPQSYPYVVRSGDTIVTLAQRFLGNRLKAYQLLRYNGFKAPLTLAAGQVLRIPGEPPRPEPVRRPDAPAAPVRPAPSPSPAAPKPKPAPAAPKANPAAARQLRTAGLAALNQGQVVRAVGLLRRASQLDPANPLIARDLARAERIAATVRAKK